MLGLELATKHSLDVMKQEVCTFEVHFHILNSTFVLLWKLLKARNQTWQAVTELKYEKQPQIDAVQGV